MKYAMRVLGDERGMDLMEYGLLVAFVAAMLLAVLITDPFGFATLIQDAYQRAVG